MKAVLRDRDGLVEAVCPDMHTVLLRLGQRSVDRVDVWPGRDENHCQLGITLADGASTIFDLPLPPSRAKGLLLHYPRRSGWPEPTIHAPRNRAEDQQ